MDLRRHGTNPIDPAEFEHNIGRQKRGNADTFAEEADTVKEIKSRNNNNNIVAKDFVKMHFKHLVCP